MILKYMGHAFFTISLENGKVIAIDPYGSFYGFPKRSVQADYCLVSHHHFDHDGMESLQPGAEVFDTAGTHRLDGAVVTAVPTWHDEKQGALRGSNLFHVIETEGLRIGHAGDLGHVPTAEQIKKIGRLDVLLLPVGGYYTIDAETALEVCRLLQPVTMIPMHYRTKFDEEMPTTTLQDFLKLAKAEDQQMPLVRITRGDILERPQVITMAIQE